MIIDPTVLPPADMYRFMISAIVPRPIAFVSTRAPDGRHNLAPFSYFVPLTNRPPLVGISLQNRRGAPKDTARNIAETGEYVINSVSEAMAERMVLASGDWAPQVDEFALAGFTPLPSDRVKPPRVAESAVQLECRLHQSLRFGEATFVVGEILRAHVRDDVLDERGHVDPARLASIGRLGADAYAPLRDVLRIPRPRADERGLPPA